VLLLGEKDSYYFIGLIALRLNLYDRVKITRLAPLAMRHTRRSSLLRQICLVNPQNDEHEYELQKYLVMALRPTPEWPALR